MSIVSLHLGQAGVQLGDVCWSQYTTEHSIGSEGYFLLKENPSTITLRSGMDLSSMTLKSRVAYDFGDSQYDDHFTSSEGFLSFFQECSEGQYVPRAVFVDLESSVIDEVKNGPLKGLYSENYLIGGMEDAANNYARGYCTVGKAVMPIVEDTLRGLVEACDKLQGFMLFHSTGGGTGSGFHALLNKYLSHEYPKCNKLGVEIFPSPRLSTAVVEPYNCILNKNETLQNTDCVFIADNEAMYNICQKKLGIDSPNYNNLNRLLAVTVSSMTSSLRFKGSLNADFIDFQTNLVPFPRVHFPIITYAPITNNVKASHETLTITDLTMQVFNPSGRLATCDGEGRYIACCLLYRGDVTPKDVNSAVAHVKEKKSIQFVDWSPTGFKLGINHKTANYLPGGGMAAPRKTVCMLANTTAVSKCWQSLNRKFNMMLKKKAFIHWYTGEGLEEQEFEEAKQNILTLEADYESMS